jgi:hypothetical protein
MAGAGRQRIQRACVSPPPRPAPGQGCRIGLAETINGSERTGLDRHTDRRSELIYKIKQGACHCSLAIYIKKYLNAKEDLWKLKYSTMQKYNLQKIL